MSAQKEDKEGWCEVDKDVLEVEECCEKSSAHVEIVLRERGSAFRAEVNEPTHLSRGDDAPEQNPEQEAIVLPEKGQWSRSA